MSMVLIRAALEARLAQVPPLVPAVAFTVGAGSPALLLQQARMGWLRACL